MAACVTSKKLLCHSPLFNDVYAAAGTWSDLLGHMIFDLAPPAVTEPAPAPAAEQGGDDPDCPFVMRMLAAVLGTRSVCPRWSSTNSWQWSIPMHTIHAYPISIQCGVLYSVPVGTFPAGPGRVHTLSRALTGWAWAE